MTAHDGSLTALEQADAFVGRHIGPRDEDVASMLKTVGYESLDALMDAAVPESIRAEIPADFPESRTERDVLTEMAALAGRNRVARSMIGLGYHDTITPPVIQRNILENPGWYTAYTPYQPEISQGRLEALLNFQTTIMDLTGLSCANASLLDEATAAAEAMHMSHGIAKNGSDRFFVSDACLPQTIAVVQTRAEAIGIEVEVGDHRYRSAGGAVLRRAAAIPRDRRRGAGLPRYRRAGACARRGGHGRGGSAQPGPAEAARRIRGRYCGGQLAALRRPPRLRRAPCRLLRHPRQVSARHAGPDRRRLGG